MTERKRTRLYSRRGDLGETSLLFGPRVGKDHRRIELIGALDELSGWLGLARAEGLDADVDALVVELQGRLFVVGAEVATTNPAKYEVETVGDDAVKALETAIDDWDAKLDPAGAFLLSGGSKSAATLHLARAVCRRAERRAVALLRFDDSFSPRVVAWLNRLSGLLYVLARFECKRAGVEEKRFSFK